MKVGDKKENFTDYGQIGDPNLASSTFYISMPYATYISWDNKVIESNGVAPDILELRDRENKEGLDNQLERAFEYIDTGR
jgi:C-terminal processing protease CtpA/Prc